MTTPQGQPPGPEPDLDLRRLVGTIRRRKRMIALVAILVTGLAGAYSYSRVPIYSARADVLVRPILVDPFDADPTRQISMETEAELTTSTPVVELAAETLGIRDDGELADHVKVRAPEGTQILEITFSALEPALAQRGAEAFADAYLTFKSGQAIDAVGRYASSLRGQIADLDEEIADLDAELKQEVRDSPTWRSLRDRLNGLQTSRIALQNQQALVNTLSLDPGQVVKQPEVPGAPSSPKHKLNLALGAVIGLLAGIGLASFSERVRDSVESPADLERILEAPTLGLIPRGATRGERSAEPVTVRDPTAPTAEAYRTLRTNLLGITRRSPVRSLLVTSAEIGEGKSTVAVNLATTLALAGRSVVLISGDLRRPTLHALLGVENRTGVAQVLAGAVQPGEALVDTDVPNLRLLPSGAVEDLGASVDLLQSVAMRMMLERYTRDHLVVIDGPPIPATADSLVLAELVDGVVFVVDARAGSRSAVVRAKEMLEPVGGRILGGVLNRAEMLNSMKAYARRRGMWSRNDRGPVSEGAENGRARDHDAEDGSSVPIGRTPSGRTPTSRWSARVIRADRSGGRRSSGT